MTASPSRPRSVNAAPFLWGAALGGLAGAGYVLAKKYGRGRSDQLFDWDQITAVALRTGAQGAAIDPTTRREIELSYAEILREVAEPLARYTGTGLDLEHTEIRVLDRADWIRANVANFKHMFDPLEQTWKENQERGGDLPGVAALGRGAISAEMGILLGYLARRVLGQYDITLLSPEQDPGKLYFVEPNIQGVQMKLGLPRREFRTWLTLHEATHAHEFEGYPWVRGYMNDLLQRYMKSMVEQLLEGKLGGLSSVGMLESLMKGQSLIESAMTPAQREIFDKLQALMTLLEGYATHIMSAVGEGIVPHYQEIEDRVEARQHQRSFVEVLFLRLTGLSLKFEQYRLGTSFVAEVDRQRGSAFLNRVWEGPEHLPSMEEFAHPSRWIGRMETVAA
jgi:coenzyme F420 biosynthesis associated uncharacterized protein